MSKTIRKDDKGLGSKCVAGMNIPCGLDADLIKDINLGEKETPCLKLHPVFMLQTRLGVISRQKAVGKYFCLFFNSWKMLSKCLAGLGRSQSFWASNQNRKSGQLLNVFNGTLGPYHFFTVFISLRISMQQTCFHNKSETYELVVRDNSSIPFLSFCIKQLPGKLKYLKIAVCA
jgi:hypothetical protein